MIELKPAITVVEITVGVVALLLLGDYLGYKMRRKRLAAILGLIVLATIVLFVIYAAVALA